MVLCEICDDSSKKVSNYKCPTCLIKYCSLECWKSHQSKGCVKKEENIGDKITIDTKPKGVLYPTDDTVHLSDLEKLRENTELKDLLKNPALRDLIKEVDSSVNVKQTIHDAMLEPIFSEFADVCLRIVEPPDESAPIH